MSSAVLRVGLCCTFLEAEIRFRRTTARYVSTLGPVGRREHLQGIARDNVLSLSRAVEWCARHGIGAYRIPSQLLPLYTHPQFGSDLEDLDPRGGLRRVLRSIRREANAAGVRLSFHPDQFVVPGSATESSVQGSLSELEYQARVGALVGVEQITIHGGGAAGGKAAALERLRDGLGRLSPAARALIALENDDRVFTVEDLLPICLRDGYRLVYDVHHHRVNPDGFSVEEATREAAATWAGREPWAHLSSPAGGWAGPNPRAHADYVDPADVPKVWLDLTVDVEAKAKELAVLRLLAWLRRPRPVGRS